MSWIVDRYQLMQERERKLLWILVICVLAAGYLFWAAFTWEQMFHVEKMANRKADRIEKRLGDVKIPTLEEGISPQVLDASNQTLREQTRQLRTFAEQRLPLNDASAREALKLELAQLASSNFLRVSRLTSNNTALRPNHDSLEGAALRDHFAKRPQFLFSLGGHYLNLIAFLDALPNLSYHTYVTDIALERIDDSEGYLKIELTLQL